MTTTRRYATITLSCALDVKDGIGEEELEETVRSLFDSVNPRRNGVEVYNPDHVEVHVEEEETCRSCGYISGHEYGCDGGGV